jgi:hypothetical protein
MLISAPTAIEVRIEDAAASRKTNIGFLILPPPVE